MSSIAVPAPGALPVHNWQCAPCPWVHEGSLHMGVQEVSYFKDCLLWSRKGEGPAPPLLGIPTDSKCTGWRAHCTQRAVDRKRVFFFFYGVFIVAQPGEPCPCLFHCHCQPSPTCLLLWTWNPQAFVSQCTHLSSTGQPGTPPSLPTERTSTTQQSPMATFAGGHCL